MKLKSLQDEFQHYLLDQPNCVLDQVRGNSRADTKTMMKVYHHAYKARLAGCLATDFPTLAAFMGGDEFTKMAYLYVADYPSTTRSVRWLGRHLPEFLAERFPYKNGVILADLARFEWAIAHAFDAQDAKAAGMADLAILPLESWAGLKLIFHPSLKVLTLTSLAPALREMIMREEDVTHLDRSSKNPSQWWVWRQDLEVKYHQALEDEAASLVLMQKGGDFAQMCDGLIPLAGEERASFRAAEILRAWLEWGMITDIAYETLSSLA